MRVAFIIIFLFHSALLWANDNEMSAYEKQLLEEIKLYEQLNINFNKICFDQNGEFRQDTIVSTDNGNIDCNEHAIALRQHFIQLNAKVVTMSVTSHQMVTSF